LRITNCHIHTFTHEHAPSRFVNPVVGALLRVPWLRRALLRVVRLIDRGKRGKIARLGEILETTHNKSQEDVFALVRGYYPEETRFVVLPMDMEHMGRGTVKEKLKEQHDELARLRRDHPQEVIPFVAVDPRRPTVVDDTIERLEQGFRGIKLYPPLGYHPDNPRLRPLYEYAEDHGHPVITHCSRPAGVTYKGPITEEMRTDPETGKRLDLPLDKLLLRFTDPDAYRPILDRHPRLRICLAHFGGARDWNDYLDRPRGDEEEQLLKPSVVTDALRTVGIFEKPIAGESWLRKIVRMLGEDGRENLWADISYTVFADDEFVYLLKVLLTEAPIRRRVLFGSDFYVVAGARLEERRRSMRIRAVLGEDTFREIAETNPAAFLGP
jgi:predicted TIM-barrel fold metal-dependent hydrolase